MTTLLRLPDQAVPFLLLQRTDLKSPLLSAVSSKFSIPYHPVMTSLETMTNKEKIKQAYAEDMEKEFAALAPWLPSMVRSVLDVGCGIAGIDALLYHHFQTSGPVTYYLLDRSAIEGDMSYGLKEGPEYYNSLPLAVETLTLNGVAPEQIKAIDVGAPGFVLQPLPGIDLVISLISWGFHYPVTTYLDVVFDSLSPGGTLILDVRHPSDGLAALEAKFGQVTTIQETTKSKRVMAKKPG